MPFLQSDAEVVLAYLEFRDRVVSLIREIPESQATLSVPLCPDWEVSSVISHMVGVPEDILSGRMEGVTTDAWTQAQVDRHEGESLSQLADALLATAVEFDVVLPHIPSPTNSQMVMDAVTHEHDLRHAVGRAGAQDSLAVNVALGWLLNMVEGKAPDLAQELLDSGVSHYELMRSLTGRRSVDQMKQIGVDGEQIKLLLQGTPLRVPMTAIEF
jgi:uncharacterized protein (TIGR03083 family)